MIQAHLLTVHIYNRDLCGFGSGSGGSGNCYVRTLYFPFQSAPDQRFLAGCIQTGFDSLGGIYAGTAADRNQAVAVFSVIQFRSGFCVSQVRIGMETGKHRSGKQPGFFLHQHAGQRFHANNHRLPDAGFIRQFP